MRDQMPTNIRLTQAEQEALRRKAVEINKELVKRGMQPMKDSELVHAFLERAIGGLELTASGAISAAVNDFGRATKKIGRTAVHVAAIDSRQLPDAERHRLDHVRREIHMAAAAAKATRLALVRLPDTAIRRPVSH